MVKYYVIFQGYYFFYYLGMDCNLWDNYKDYLYFMCIIEFVSKYDLLVFDFEVEILLLFYFEFMVWWVFVKFVCLFYKKVV